MGIGARRNRDRARAESRTAPKIRFFVASLLIVSTKFLTMLFASGSNTPELFSGVVDYLFAIRGPSYSRALEDVVKIRTRLVYLLVVTLTALSMSVAMFFVYTGTSGGLQRTRTESLTLGKEIFRLMYLSDELLTSTTFASTFESWKAGMNSKEDAKQRQALKNVWALVLEQASFVADTGRVT
jgi:hypothetical protein